MNRPLFLLALTALSAATLTILGCASLDKTPPATVAAVDLQRYAGTWYEIARFPHSFEKGAEKVTATYTPLPDGRIKVENRSTKNGEPNNIEGTASVVPGSNGEKLKVKFFTLLPAGNYWVLELDEKGYQWAIVGEGSRNYLWILARKPQMEEGLYQELVAKAKAKGYDVSKLERVKQE